MSSNPTKRKGDEREIHGDRGADEHVNLSDPADDSKSEVQPTKGAVGPAETTGATGSSFQRQGSKRSSDRRGSPEKRRKVDKSAPLPLAPVGPNNQPKLDMTVDRTVVSRGSPNCEDEKPVPASKGDLAFKYPGGENPKAERQAEEDGN